MKYLLTLCLLTVMSLFAFEEISINNINEKIKDKKVILDFYATWCPPCKVVSKQLEKFDAQNKSNVTIYKIDIDKNRELLSRYDIKSIPTLVYIKNGSIQFKQVGIVDKTTIEKNVKQYLD